MADLATTAWAATELGDGWRKWSSTKTWSTTAIDTLTTPEMPQDVKDYLGNGGSVNVGLQLGAGTIGNVTLAVQQDDESTFTSPFSLSLDVDAAASTDYLYAYGDNLDGSNVSKHMRLRLSRASGTAANTTALDLVYKSDNNSQSEMTISGAIGADPS